MTATEASRRFTAVLDEAERGETVIVTRAGRRVAVIGPVSASNGAAVRSLLASREVDADFAADVLAVRAAVTAPESAWPAD